MDECHSKVCAKGPELTKKAGPLVILSQAPPRDQC